MLFYDNLLKNIINLNKKYGRCNKPTFGCPEGDSSIWILALTALE